jgi:hypothetical protein
MGALPSWKRPDGCRRGVFELLPQRGDLTVLSGKARQRHFLELLQGVELGVLPAEAFAQGCDLGLEAFDLRQAWVGLLSGFPGGGPLAVELGL